MSSLESVTSPRSIAPGRFQLEIEDGWQQGRGAFGGLVLGAMVRAAEQHAATPEKRLRTLTAELCGPVLTGVAELSVEALRVGSGTTTLAVRLTQGGEVQAHAVVVLGRARAPEPRLDGIVWPAPPPWAEVPVIPAQALAPRFAQHFELRLVGPPPFAGGEAKTAGWVRARAPGAARDAAFLTAHADAWWPALWSAVSAPRPAATITFMLDVLGDCVGLDPEAPLFHSAYTLAARDGWAPELRTLWGADGRLLAVNHQTFVIIK